MRSTGEVLGIAKTTGEAFFKAEEAAKATLPLEGAVLLSVNAQDKPDVAQIAQSFYEDGFRILATGETCSTIEKAGVPVTRVLKKYEGRPNVQDLITNGDIQLIINSPVGSDSVYDDSYLRKAAIKARIPYITTIAAARAAAEGIRQIKENGTGNIHSLQSWHARIGNE